MGRRTLITLLAFAVTLGTAAPAMAAGAPWYRDGPAGRILLAGSWLFRADPNDEGLGAGWAGQQDTSGWTSVTVPSAWNAGDYSDASMAGSVWLWIAGRSGHHGLIAHRPRAPWGPLADVFPHFTGGAWPYVLLVAVLTALAIPVIREEIEVRRRLP